MAAPRIIVLRAPGTNCDVETAFAFEAAGGRADRVHVFRLLEQPRVLQDYQVLCIPGGFSYGDDVGAGAILGQALRGRLGEVLGEFLHGDRLVLGICNGFQVLMRAGILPGGAAQWPPPEVPAATLTWNDNGRYTACWVHLAANSRRSVFLRGIDRLELPVAHGEGKIVVRDSALLKTWRDAGQIALAYCAPEKPGSAPCDSPQSLPFPLNPNGSMADIAGLCDESGRVLGLMPHPERHVSPWQHPQWTRRTNHPDEGAGMKLFRNAVDYFR